MSDSQFQWLLTIFYIAYILFQFQVVYVQVVPAEKMDGVLRFLLGSSRDLSSCDQELGSMMVARFAMAWRKLAMGPAGVLYLSFFTRKQR